MRLRKKHWAIPEMMENKYVIFNGKEYKGKWKEEFGNDNPIHIEIGSGRGSFMHELSKRNPDINYIMIEVESNAFVYATRKFVDEDITNVRALPINAETISEYFTEGEVSRIYINFCNPWPKNRHHKRRLTHPRFISEYKKILCKNSELHLKTDDLDFFNDTLEYVEEMGLEILEHTFDLKQEEYPDNIITEYETKWRSRNIPIKYGKFKF